MDGIEGGIVSFVGYQVPKVCWTRICHCKLFYAEKVPVLIMDAVVETVAMCVFIFTGLFAEVKNCLPRYVPRVVGDVEKQL